MNIVERYKQITEEIEKKSINYSIQVLNDGYTLFIEEHNCFILDGPTHYFNNYQLVILSNHFLKPNRYPLEKFKEITYQKINDNKTFMFELDEINVFFDILRAKSDKLWQERVLRTNKSDLLVVELPTKPKLPQLNINLFKKSPEFRLKNNK